MIQNVVVRKASVSDLSVLQQMSAELIDSDNRFNNARLLREWSLGEDGAKYLLKRIRGKKGLCIVAEIEGNVVGYITGKVSEIQKWRPYRRAEIDNLFVRENFRNIKIGSCLIDAFITWAKSRGVEKIFLFTMADNKEGIQFYEHKHFKKLGIELEKDI